MGIFIPKPCKENWSLMTPEEQGRHCTVCNKVVRDFTSLNQNQIEEEIHSATGQVCGRVSAEALNLDQAGIEVFYKFPPSRMRVFLIAFLTAFGPAVFGMDFPDRPESISSVLKFSDEMSTNSSASDDPYPSDTIKIRGIALDQETGEPLPFVTLLVEVDGKVIAGASADSEGIFYIRFSIEDAVSKKIDLVVSFLGKSRRQENIPFDIEEMVVLIDGTTILSTDVVIEAESALTGEIMVGIIQMPPIIEQIEVNSNGSKYYHKLDDFIQMRNSEVFSPRH